MAKLVIISFLTIDGVMQAPGGSDEDKEDGFKHGGWQIPYFGDVGELMPDMFDNIDAMLLGRKTYDIFAGYWPTTGKIEAAETAESMNKIPKYVASNTLKKLAWENSQLLEGDVPEAVRKLKSTGDGKIIIFGSADLAQTLMKHNLIDQYDLLIHPLVLGTGKRLFREGGPQLKLKLANSKTSSGGVVRLTYAAKQSG